MSGWRFLGFLNRLAKALAYRNGETWVGLLNRTEKLNRFGLVALVERFQCQGIEFDELSIEADQPALIKREQLRRRFEFALGDQATFCYVPQPEPLVVAAGDNLLFRRQKSQPRN